jgi:chromate transporter
MMAYIKLFFIFFKVGMFSFGGGYAMLPMIYQDIQKFGLMPAEEFSNLVALSQMTPGPIAVNAATYVGFKSAGWGGAISATAGVALPSLLIILLIAAFIEKFKTNAVMQAVLAGIRPATVGMVAAAVIFFAKTSLFQGGGMAPKFWGNPFSQVSLPALAIVILTLIGAEKLKIGPITLTLLAGLAGLFIF